MAGNMPTSEPVAIVGSACRFAGGATSPSKLWKLVANPTDHSREIPAERFNIKGFYHPDGEYHGTTNSPKAYFLDQDHRVFDNSFFNIIPKEAEAIDPQQRLLLEVVYEALESAGYTLPQYAGRNVAVYAGLMTGDYDTHSQRDDIFTSQYYATGNARAILANRVSYFFNFHGPSMTIDTACSSSLVALDEAISNLRSGRSEMACVTGANLILTPEQFIVESSLHMLSPNGHCRMWDSKADGYARGEGIAAIFIKSLSQAIADGDRIEAVIRETGVNSDGRTKGITMPNWVAQSTLIQDTYRRAGLDPKSPQDRCQFFEAHGTGTSAGDPNEARAIENAFFSGTSDSSKLLVGSVKTVIGHTEGAAGLAGVLKVVQAINHASVAPNLHLKQLSDEVKKYTANLVVPTHSRPWPKVDAGQPRRASVNSFGFGGTNAHAIIEQYVPKFHSAMTKHFQSQVTLPQNLAVNSSADMDEIRLPLVLSANSSASLASIAQAYRDYLAADPLKMHIEDVAWHLYARRTAFPFRASVTGNTPAELIKNLESLTDKIRKSTASIKRVRPDDEHPKILGVFTGQGAQWATMSRGLLKSNPVYAKSIRFLDGVLRSCPDPPAWSLELEIMAEKGMSRVGTAAVAQPLCTAVQVALVDLLRSIGVTFHVVIGHSSGEIAAAYAAGRLSARDAILVSYYRGKFAHLAQGDRGVPGGMLAAGISMEEAAKLCAKKEYSRGICVAASNSPTLVTLSGDIDIVKQVHQDLLQQAKFARVLTVDTAYHSPHMELPASKYVEALEHSNLTPTTEGNGTAWISSVYGHGEPRQNELALTYWGDNMVNPVLFHEAVVSVLTEFPSLDCAIEVGPHPTLKSPVTQVLRNGGNTIPYSGLLDRNADDRVAFAEFLGWMWSQFGSASQQIREFVIKSSQPDLVGSRLDDPPLYTWDHSQSYYRESRIARQYHSRTHAPHELLGVRTRDDNEFQLRWRNILKHEKLSWAEGHVFQGQILLPASAYCAMAYDAARVVLAGRTASLIELQDLKFLNGITLEPKSQGVEVLFSLTVEDVPVGKQSQSIIKASIILSSATLEGNMEMKKNFSATLRIVLGHPDPECLPTRPKEGAETVHADPSAFYDMMKGTGLEYTGAFQGLTSLRKRCNFASGRVKKRHADDTTSLAISPGTLDSCLQTAFLTVSSPGDRSLWTSFLPKTIDRVRFNTATCDIDNHGDMLAVDAYLTDASPTSPQAAASFTADINIFGSEDNMEIMVEGLKVAAFTTTKPEDDHELYLTTVMDVDPDDRIHSIPIVNEEMPSPMLVESCERVASFFMRKASLPAQVSRRIRMPARYDYDLQLATDRWTSETRETLEAFITASPYFYTLDFLRRLGRNLPDVVKGMLPTVIEETHHLVRFQEHISRVVKQIAHKYPQINVLGLTAPELGLTEHVLTGLGDSFTTYRIGVETEKNLETHILTPQRRKKVVCEGFGLEQEEAPDELYDLVLLTTSDVEHQTIQHVLRKIRAVMRPGGFLIFIHVCGRPLKDRLCLFAGQEHDYSMMTPPDWPDLLDGCGFKHSMKNSEQYFPSGYSMSVRQAESEEKQVLRKPFSRGASHLTDRLLIVGGKELWTSLISTGISQALASGCDDITTVETFDHINPADASSYSAVILLNDIDEPILATMTPARMDTFRALLRPEMTILWVTQNSRVYNPDCAASMGFARTIVAETPGLCLQMLDLDTIDTQPAVDTVAESFARLTMRQLVDSRQHDAPLWVHENEIYIEGGCRLIPRCVPWKEGNDRANAPRRVVSNPVNTVENLVKIVSTQAGDGTTQRETKIDKIDLQSKAPLGQPTIRVDYSTVHAINLGGKVSAYVCVGRDTQTDKGQVALSMSNASYIATPPTCVSSVTLEHLHSSVFVALLIRYLSAFTIAHTAEEKLILLIEPDKMFEECVKDVLVKYGLDFRICATDAKRCSLIPGMVFVHPNSSTREIKALYPEGGACVVDMLPERSEISRVLAASVPKNCRYSSGSALSTPEGLGDYTDSDFLETVWQEAVSLAMSKLKGWQSDVGPGLTTIPDLLWIRAPTHLFQILDWRADRSVPHIVKYVDQEKMLDPNKTYVLVGLTRDLGQSLCTLLVEHGARNLALVSRNPPKNRLKWQENLLSQGIKVWVESLDVLKLDQILAFKARLAAAQTPVGGVINGAMVLEDRVFSVMSTETLHRVMNPKTIGSRNLDIAFDATDMDFFIMTSSFAAIGGHAGQSNYAAANMYMNGLAASRRRRGLPGSAINIGVIYGLGFLHREKTSLYEGLEREGYPPISERDLHHMFLEAITVGKAGQDQTIDIVTGLSRFSAQHPTLPWHHDPRFSHFTRSQEELSVTDGKPAEDLQGLLRAADTRQALLELLIPAFAKQLEQLVHLPTGSVTGENSFSELGVDSLVAVDIRSWVYKNMGQDVAVMKILAAPSISKMCHDIADLIMDGRQAAPAEVAENTAAADIKKMVTPSFANAREYFNTAASTSPTSLRPRPVRMDTFTPAATPAVLSPKSSLHDQTDGVVTPSSTVIPLVNGHASTLPALN
ncbi:putative polyketide synthase [Apodospora peruviana]|uniref:Polyketide synthase n=1 Tax=Apodospora peruviana TaxID=516989 RepID=A0AAE0HUM6_9PEZI|nr:putative polyketide synthase [Apodospora peruviana]